VRKFTLACRASGKDEAVATADALGVADEERVAEDDAAADFVADAVSDCAVGDAEGEPEGVDEGDGDVEPDADNDAAADGEPENVDAGEGVAEGLGLPDVEGAAVPDADADRKVVLAEGLGDDEEDALPDGAALPLADAPAVLETVPLADGVGDDDARDDGVDVEIGELELLAVPDGVTVATGEVELLAADDGVADATGEDEPLPLADALGVVVAPALADAALDTVAEALPEGVVVAGVPLALALDEGDPEGEPDFVRAVGDAVALGVAVTDASVDVTAANLTSSTKRLTAV